MGYQDQYRPPKNLKWQHDRATAPSLEPAGMLRIAGSQMALERVRGRSH
jgi:hypothetical protein